jgi:hypothetical protein
MAEMSAGEAARRMLEELMEERRWRVPQVAETLGLSVDIVRRWLQGKSRMQLEDMVAIARLKGADLNEVFGLQPQLAAVAADVDLDALVERKVKEALAGMLAGLATGALEPPRPDPAAPHAGRGKGRGET